MTTYELPPEPPVGSRVKSIGDHTWTRTVHAGWTSPTRTVHAGWTWGSLMAHFAPLTLIEPDPWPTAPLIVADWIATGAAKGHGLAHLDGYEYVTVEPGHVLRYGRDTLANVVPVRVVPVAEWEALVEKVRSFYAARTDNQWRVVTARAAELLVAATDALGLDQ